MLIKYGSGILDSIQFVLDIGGMLGDNLIGIACDALNALISLVRNRITEFVVGILGVLLPMVAASTLKKIAKTKGYEKVITFIADKVSNAVSLVGKGIKNIGE